MKSTLETVNLSKEFFSEFLSLQSYFLKKCNVVYGSGLRRTTPS